MSGALEKSVLFSKKLLIHNRKFNEKAVLKKLIVFLHASFFCLSHLILSLSAENIMPIEVPKKPTKIDEDTNRLSKKVLKLSQRLK